MKNQNTFLVVFFFLLCFAFSNCKKENRFELSLTDIEIEKIKNLKPGEVAEKKFLFTYNEDNVKRAPSEDCCTGDDCCCFCECSELPCICTCTDEIIIITGTPQTAVEENKLFYGVQTDSITIYASSQKAIDEVKLTLNIKEKTVLYQELDCLKDGMVFRAKASSLEDTFNRMVDDDWDCILILDE